MQSPVTVSGLGLAKYESTKYANINIYLPAKTSNNKTALILISVEVHLINNLKANLLLGVDILGTYGITLDYSNQQMLVNNCKDTVVQLKLTPKNNAKLFRTVRANLTTHIPPKSTITIPISYRPLPTNRDFYLSLVIWSICALGRLQI